MDPATWSRMSDLFDTARDLPGEQLPSWMEHIGNEQPDLLPWLRSMLQAHAERRADDWLERGPTVEGGPEASASPGTGARIGPWVLHEMLGSGGMATVWRATRADALPARDVALKLPLDSHAGLQLAERFARERDILSRLEHPHIARLYDAGVTEQATPWLAMELVHGLPIHQACDARRLGPAERIQLFLQVLDALQYAHARLVIHRDLKPSNILLDDSGQVRVLDFGIAKLLVANSPDDPSAEPTALTRAAGRAMTLSYAAPEQVRGEPLTTAADIYALGVVLFELLAGQTPYRMKFRTAAQLEQAIAAGDSWPASVAAAQDDAAAKAAVRGCTPRSLRRALAGDLDAILAQAMAADPAQRYASASAFADDLTRHLKGLPVHAQPGSLLRRCAKFTRRNRWPVAAASAVLLALLAGAGVALWQADVARHQRNIALAEAERSSAINFFFGDLLESAGRSAEPVSGDALITRAEALARKEFGDRPDALASVLISVGTLHNSLGRTAEARRIFEEAHVIARDSGLRDDAACDLALLLEDRARALALLSPLVSKPGNSARSRTACLVYLGDLLRSDQPIQALQRYGEALLAWERDPSGSPYDRITIVGRQAYAMALVGRTRQAVAAFETAIAEAATLGRDGFGMGSALRNRLGRTLLMVGDPARAASLFEQNLREHAQRLPGAPRPADSLINQGMALLDLHQPQAALPTLQAAQASAIQGGNRAQQAQGACLAQTALLQLDPPRALAAPDPAAAVLADSASEPISRALCGLTHAQTLWTREDWAALDTHLGTLLAAPLPEPQWTVQARMLRAEARLRAGRKVDAAADADAALAESRRVQDGMPDTPRTLAARNLVERSRR